MTAAPPTAPGGRSGADRSAWWIVGAGVVLVLVQLIGSIAGGSDLPYLAATVGAAIVAALGLRRPGVDVEVGSMVTLGLAASALGDLAWQTYLWSDRNVPDVSWADLGWLAAYVFIGRALFVIIRRSDYRLRRDPDALIDVLVISVMVALGVWLFWVAPALSNTAVPLAARGVGALYAVLDALLLGLIARVLLRVDVRGPAVGLLGIGMGLWLIADLGYVVVPTSTRFDAAMDAGWMLGAVLMAASVWTLRPVDTAPSSTQPPATARRAPARGRVIAAALPMAVPWVIELWAAARGWVANPVPLFAASVALAGLFCARTLHILESQRRSELLFRAAAQHSSDATLILSAQGQLLQDAPGLAGLLGEGNAVAGTDLRALVHRSSDDHAWLDDLLRRAVRRPGEAVEREVPFDQTDGSRTWLLVRIVNLLDTPGVHAVLINLHDVSDRKRVEAELEHQAFHDPLTGLANRALFADRLEHAFEQKARSGLDPAVLFLDLDGFKSVNDRLGHDAGDELILEVSRRLVSAVRAGDTVARLGGDEFAVLIEHSTDPLGDATGISQRVLDGLAAPTVIRGVGITTTASIGIAPGHPESTPSSILRDADTAMYHAKAAGRARAVVYDAEMREQDDVRVRVEADLDEAIAARQLRIEYQPVVDLGTGAITGFEALLRWTHPSLGEVSPEIFIPAAERSGSIVDLGAWTLRAACDQLADWQRSPGLPLSVAVNVSGRQLADPGFTRLVTDAVRASGISPRDLTLEVTETVVISDIDHARDTLTELRTLGVQLAIDDFGTGYSSLSYLQHLPVDILKIDRSFTSTVREQRPLPDIVHGILDLAHTLGLSTVAEGIETTAQLDQLRAAGCEAGQGFLFSRSLTPDAATEVLGRTHRTAGPLLDPRSGTVAAPSP